MTEVVDITKVKVEGSILKWLFGGFPEPAERILKLTREQQQRIYDEVSGTTAEDMTKAVKNGATFGSWQIEVSE